MGIIELQERLEVPVQICISIQQGQKMFEVFWHEEEGVCVASWAMWFAQWKSVVELARRCQDISREYKC